MIIHFPAMHSGLLMGPAPEAGLFFDPGFLDKAGEGMFRPQPLPLSPAIARRIIADSITFGEQFAKSSDMAVMALFQQAEDQEHSWTIRSELEQRLSADFKPATSAAPGEKPGLESSDQAQAQFLLLLAYATQKHGLELKDLNRGVEAAKDRFSENLGLGNDEYGDKAVESIARTIEGTGKLDDSPEPLPWPWILGAMAAYLPENTILAASSTDVAATWADLDLDFSLAEPGLGLPAGWKSASGPAWKLAGMSKAATGAHWERELVVAMP